MSRILITGGAGFIGFGVAKALAARGDQVIAFDIARSTRLDSEIAQHRKIEFIQVEISEWPQVVGLVQSRKPDAVVHCAAIVGVPNSLASPIGTFRVNVDGSLNVFEAMRLCGVRRVVNLSSEETYGIFDKDKIDETHPNRPLKPYGISKYAVERLACDYVSAYGMEIIHVRTCWVYGPGLPRPRVPKILIDAAVAGRKLHLPNGGDFRVDHVYIDDCVDGIVKALDKPSHRYDVYHISTGEAPSLAEIVALSRSSRRVPISRSVRGRISSSTAPKRCARARSTSRARAPSSATSRDSRSRKASPLTSRRHAPAVAERT